MLTSFREVEDYLYQLPAQQRDPAERLEHVRRILDSLGNPQDAIPAIHIAGTSGKGSTAYYAASLLHEGGYTVGLCVSPHVNSVAERSQVNGEILDEGVYCEHINEFISQLEAIEAEVSYIEFLDVFAYWLFHTLNLDYVVMEVGLGGRLDPTNVITRPDKVSVITDIGFDHVEILGDTITAIAGEKAGIILRGNKVVMHRQPAEVTEVMERAASEQGAKLTVIEPGYDAPQQLPLFQQRNWTLAKEAVALRLECDSKTPLTDEALATSLETRIPGRFEIFHDDATTIVLDTAHNPQKITALIESLNQLYPGEDVVYLVSFGKNKQTSMNECLEVMYSLSGAIYTTSFTATLSPDKGSILPTDIADAACEAGFEEAKAINDPYEAYDHALATAKKHGAVLVVTGSFYLIDGIRMALVGGVPGLLSSEIKK